MSINITSTSDRMATDSPTSSSSQESAQEGEVRKHQDLPSLLSAVPDPAVIAKLARG